MQKQLYRSNYLILHVIGTLSDNSAGDFIEDVNVILDEVNEDSMMSYDVNFALASSTSSSANDFVISMQGRSKYFTGLVRLMGNGD